MNGTLESRVQRIWMSFFLLFERAAEQQTIPKVQSFKITISSREAGLGLYVKGALNIGSSHLYQRIVLIAH